MKIDFLKVDILIIINNIYLNDNILWDSDKNNER